MNRYFVIFLFVPFVFSSCTKCVECEVKLKQSQTVLGNVDEFCGTDKDVEDEEARLSSDYSCIKCTVFNGQAPISSGVQCGDRELTERVREKADSSALFLGTSASCIYFNDTARVTCVLVK